MALDGAAFGAPPEPSYQPARRGKFRFLTYPFRFLFRVFKRTIAGALRTVAFRPVSSLLFLVLFAAVGFLGYRDYSGTSGAGSGSDSGYQAAPSPAAEDFIKGQTTFNAALMWQSFNDDFKQRLTSRGTNEQTLQQQLDQRKQAGAKVDQVYYAGGVQTPEGSRVFMYVLTMEAPNNQGTAEAHYVLTVDQNDKIANVE